MAATTIQIIAQVRDQASNELGKVKKSLDKVSGSVDKAGFNLTQLNRTLFSTKAIFSMISRTFGDFKQSLTEAANIQRVEDSFKNVFGANSDILRSLDSFSSIGVDRMDAMKNAIALGMLGIAKNSDDAAKILAGAAFGAKQAGVDTSEGMHKIIQGLKDGSLSGLEYLNMIRTSDPALKAQLELLHKYSGSIGGAVSAQAKYNLILSITSRLSQLAANNQEDYVDLIQKTDNSLNVLKQTFGIFLNKSFEPYLRFINNTVRGISTFIDSNTKLNKGLIYLARGFLGVTAAVTGLYAGLVSLKLISAILGTTGAFGIPALAMGMAGLAGAFLLTTNKATGLIDKLKLFGNFIEGIYQLVSNLDTATGLSKIDTDIKNILEENGIFKIAQNVARLASVIISVGKIAASTIKQFAVGVMDFIDPIISKLQTLFGLNGKSWSKSLVDGTSSVTKNAGRLVALLASLYGATKLFSLTKGIFGGLGGGFLSRIPGVNKIFGGVSGRRGPAGSEEDPIYTRQVGLAKMASVAKDMPIIGKFLDFLKPFLAALASNIPLVIAGALVTALAGYAASQMIKMPTPFGFMSSQEADQQEAARKRREEQQRAVGESAFREQVQTGTFAGMIGTPEMRQQAYLQQYGIPAGAPSTLAPAALAKEAIGLSPDTNKAAYIPNIPHSQRQQLELLQATKEAVEPREKDIFVSAINQLQETIKSGITDPEVTAKMAEEAYVRAIARTKEPIMNRTPSKRGC